MMTDKEKELLKNYADKLLDVPCYYLDNMEAIQIASEVHERVKNIKTYVSLATSGIE